MSASNKWGTYKTPCPNCGGVINYWHYGADCLGNPSYGVIKCKGECQRDFTKAEWEIIASDEVRKIQKNEALKNLALKAQFKRFNY